MPTIIKQDERKARGQPTKYHKKEILEVTTKLAQIFCPSDSDIAAFLNIQPQTFCRWKKKHPELQQAINIGKAQAKITLNRKLIEKAKDGNMIALIFVLTNKFPEDWQDRRAVFQNNVFAGRPGELYNPIKNLPEKEIDDIVNGIIERGQRKTDILPT